MYVDMRPQLESLREQLTAAGFAVDPVRDNAELGQLSFVIRAQGTLDRTVWCEVQEDRPCFRWQPSTVDPIAPADDVDAAVRVIRGYLEVVAD
jgi:hypothetical protein